MKKLVLIVALALFGIVNQASAHLIVDISRSNGFFGYYNHVEQQYMGQLNGCSWYTLVCENPGFIKCKLRYIARTTPRDGEIGEIESTKVTDLMTEVETNQINNGTPTGQTTRHYQSTLSDNSVIDIYVTLSWSPDPAHTGYSLFHAEVMNSED